VTEYLDIMYPSELRNTVQELDIRGRNLTGAADFSDFVNCEKLDCAGNKLTSLNLTNCQHLKLLNCSGNNLQQDLTIFSHLGQLEYLIISNNSFRGSLDHLANLKQLKYLNISDTDFNRVDLTQLPRSLEEIVYFDKYSTGTDCQLQTIIPLLETVKYGFCKQCQQPNPNYKLCHSCSEQE